jgi:hypothetical protein
MPCQRFCRPACIPEGRGPGLRFRSRDKPALSISLGKRCFVGGHRRLQFHWGDVIMPHAELLKTKGALDASGAATPVTVVAHGLAVLPPDEVALVSVDAEGFHLRGSVRFHKIQLRPQ